MRILAIDTTEGLLSLALDDGVSRWRTRAAGPQDERLFPALRRLLNKAGWKLGDLEALAVANGPGRFTGIRIGMTFATMLGRVLDRPVVAVSRFEAAAHRAYGEHKDMRRPVCVVFASGHGEFFFQLFRRSGNRAQAIGGPSWGSLSKARRELRRQGLRGAVLMGKAAASDLILPARAHLASGAKKPARPLYLKPARFERSRLL